MDGERRGPSGGPRQQAVSPDRWGRCCAPLIGLSEARLRRKFNWSDGCSPSDKLTAHNGVQRQRLFRRTEPPPGLLGLGLRGGRRSRPGRWCRSLRRLFGPLSGHPQRTLHGVVAPQRPGAAQEEKRELAEVRLRHGEHDLVPDVPVRAPQLREPQHRPNSNTPVRLYVSGLQVGQPSLPPSLIPY